MVDPACGSGSFLIYAYGVLANFYRRESERLESERGERLGALMAAGVTTPFDREIQLAPWTAELEQLAAYPRIILGQHLYGVDLDPQAAEIATVNLMIRAMAGHSWNASVPLNPMAEQTPHSSAGRLTAGLRSKKFIGFSLKPLVRVDMIGHSSLCVHASGPWCTTAR